VPPATAPREAAITTLTLREILAFDVLGPAAPVLLAGRAGLDRPVRWVHSSEVYEGYAFLYGGELLLTNGHGLAHTSAEQQRTYVRELAARGVAAVFVEVGRALPEMPAALVDESERLGLPLVALRRVVPFVRIAEAVNTAIVSLSLAERTTRRYRDSPHTAPDAAAHAAALLADLADDVPIGRAEAAARAELAGFRAPAGHRLLGLAARGLPETALRRLPYPMLCADLPGGLLALLAVGPDRDPVTAVRAALADALPSPAPRTALAEAGPLPGSRTATGVAGRATDAAGRAGERETVVGRGTGQAAGGPVVGVGPAVASEAGWERYGETVREAWGALELAVTVPPAEPVGGRAGEFRLVAARSLALERELLRTGGRERWVRLAADSLGPLLSWEARYPSDLVRTLEVHLRNGCSPTRTAALLHIGRQSLYQRLDRIEQLLGVAVGDPDQLGELLLACCAQRLVLSGIAGAQRVGASAGILRSPAYSAAVSRKPDTQVRSPIPGAALAR